jgi:hypothetical protein
VCLDTFYIGNLKGVGGAVRTSVTARVRPMIVWELARTNRRINHVRLGEAPDETRGRTSQMSMR